ncbi:MAG: response regulator transcription factor [Flavobacteriales bacterium]|nr:response regulator transcription factor [Flavobacteriales bacterium]
MTRILLVEDEPHLRKTLKVNLELDGYEVVPVGDGKEAIRLYPQSRFDLVILDVMMPGVDGYHVCEHIRLRDKETPILFLTARNTSQDRVRGLKLGGDDYLGKPFDLEELKIRIQKLLMRRQPASTNESKQFNIGGHTVHFNTFEVHRSDGSHIALSQKEVLLLKLLTERKNEVVSREEILEKVWGYDVYPSTRTIDNHIVNFRKYFEPNPRQPKYFHSVRGVGYKFTHDEKVN